MHLNPLFCFLGFGTALRDFDKALFYSWRDIEGCPLIDDFLRMYIGGGEL